MADFGSGSDAFDAGWRTNSDGEIVELATTLRSLVWSWRMDDLMSLLVVFPWHDPIIESPDWARFDAGLGAGTCDVLGRNKDAERIEVAVTTLSADNTAGRDEVRKTFDHMTAVLTGPLGEPSQRIADAIPEIRWTGEETTLLLTDLSLMVRLCLVTNTWLVEYDETNGLQGQSTT
ncbi:DUF6301 domain-containing protein [Nocardia ninae]|uniref:Uncharacterized protein n=1 Tax=Nocardia ninae NBRC 108245 TaxID=1210091 RepID=A0A511ME94_9NOCA|nr:DUF6301 family protein [Nocardia ninae]GEM38952.1 hypothetical protein NN4_34710 [Nocardia ninae NBRC 108245]